MKKLMTALAVSAVAAISMAQSSGSVTSVNVVGYSTIALTNSTTLIGVNFGLVGDGSSIAITNLVPNGQPGMTNGASSASGDNIQVLIPGGGYTTYFLCNGKIGKGGAYVPAADGWVKVGTNVVTTDAIPAGGAFWYVAQTPPVTLTLVGQVANDATKTMQLVSGLNMIANGYATALPITSNAPSFFNGGTRGASSASGDNIQVQTGAGYTTYFFCNGLIGKGGAYVHAADGWVMLGTNVVTTDSIPMGKAAWYINRGSTFTWTNSLPYSL